MPNRLLPNRLMNVRANLSALRETRWYELALRILFGGLITVATGLIAQRFGPTIGGLFLAFPAIFPASATLVEKHACEKKQRHGLDGKNRGREAASLDARGAAMGSIGLIAFALIVWQLLPELAPWLVLAVATFTWLAVSVALWTLRRLL
jgi:hypothetical protein